MSAVDGFVAPGFEPVQDVFAAQFAGGLEVGAALCIHRHGEVVVDLWGGTADVASGRPWRDDTPALFFSTTKGITATILAMVAARTGFDLDAPIADVWPEFAAEGKGAVTTRMLASHTAGVPAIDAPLTWEDVLAIDPVAAALAAQRPEWEPGTAMGYHARTYGWGVGEVVRRVDGRRIGAILAEDVAGPLGLDVWIGLPEAVEPRVAALSGAEEGTEVDLAAVLGPDHLLTRVMTGPNGLFPRYDAATWGRRDIHATEMPSSNGIGTARAVARLYAATIGEVDGIRLLAPDVLADAVAPRAEGEDRVIGFGVRFRRATGFELRPLPACPRGSFGHNGAGGSLGFADAETGIAFAYTPNRLHLGLTLDPRASSLVEALRGCL